MQESPTNFSDWSGKWHHCQNSQLLSIENLISCWYQQGKSSKERREHMAQPSTMSASPCNPLCGRRGGSETMSVCVANLAKD